MRAPRTGESLRATVVLADGAALICCPEFRRIERNSGQLAVITRVAVPRPRASVAIGALRQALHWPGVAG